MKAARIHEYGGPDRLVVEEVAAPEVGPGQVLVENFASSVNPIDWKLRSGKLRLLYRFALPTTLGFDLAGRVQALGAGATRFQIGDEVYARSGYAEGRAYAETVVQDEAWLAKKPANLNFVEAAALPLAGLTALQGLRDKGALAAGQTVLVNGASGGVGVFTVQIAKALGARVVAVCSAANAELVRGLGADEVIDYKTTDPLAGPERFDLIYDCVAALSAPRALRKLARGGRYVTTLPGPSFFFAKPLALLAGKRLEFIVVRSSGADLDTLSGLCEADRLRPVIDAEYALDDIRAAHERSAGGRARGKIVVKIR